MNTVDNPSIDSVELASRIPLPSSVATTSSTTSLDARPADASQINATSLAPVDGGFGAWSFVRCFCSVFKHYIFNISIARRCLRRPDGRLGVSEHIRCLFAGILEQRQYRITAACIDPPPFCRNTVLGHYLLFRCASLVNLASLIVLLYITRVVHQYFHAKIPSSSAHGNVCWRNIVLYQSLWRKLCAHGEAFNVISPPHTVL
jgi:hypothetical protein